MAKPRAEVVRRQLAGLATAGLDVHTFSQAACEMLARAVPYDYACLATTDPASGLITGTFKSDPGDSHDEELARYEYEADDLNQFVEIARRPIPVGVLELDTAGHPELSRRYHDFLRPVFSHGHELRLAFRTAGAVWGLLGLYRSTGLRGFAPAEAGFAASISEIVATGIRSSLMSSAATAAVTAVNGPAVVIVGADDRISQMTPAAQQRVDDLGGIIRDTLPMTLLSVIGAARALHSGRAGTVPHARVRTPAGQWLTAQAAPVSGAAGNRGEVVMTIEQAGPPEIVPLIVAAFGLTNREQDVVALVLQGADTAAIGHHLHLSPYTVQDHLKSIFTKSGVRTRRELTAKIFFELYAPRIGNPLGSDGWFCPNPRSQR